MREGSETNYSELYVWLIAVLIDKHAQAGSWPFKGKKKQEQDHLRLSFHQWGYITPSGLAENFALSDKEQYHKYIFTLIKVL